MVIGDSFGEWLAYGLEQVFAETPQIGIVRKIKTDLVWFATMRDWTDPNGCKPSKTYCRRPKKPTPLL